MNKPLTDAELGDIIADHADCGWEGDEGCPHCKMATELRALRASLVEVLLEHHSCQYSEQNAKLVAALEDLDARFEGISQYITRYGVPWTISAAVKGREEISKVLASVRGVGVLCTCGIMGESADPAEHTSTCPKHSALASVKGEQG